MIENVDRRVLGAFRWVDAVSSKPVQQPLVVSNTTPDALKIRVNASGAFVVFDAIGATALTSQFDVVSAWPAPSDFEVRVDDPSRRYLPRRAKVSFPRALTAMSDPASILNPQKIALYPSPAAPTGPNWAVIRASVAAAAGQPLPYAMVRILRASDSVVIATGMTDRNGEALLAVPGLGIRPNSNGGGGVLSTSVDVTADAAFDPDVLTRGNDWAVDPDRLLDAGNLALKRSSAVTAKIAGGAVTPVLLSIAL